jgi:D-alanyl-D-alanine carboxypeptidase (penicillin-binding protein 5/6)
MITKKERNNLFNCFIKLLNIFFIAFLLCNPSKTYAYDTNAKSAYVVDNLTGTVLLEKNATKPLPPASMSKLMTIYMIFDALRAKRISLTDEFRVSKKASQKGGSKMFLKEGEIVNVENIIRGIIIQSGNDACIAIAETLSGTEEEFAYEMNMKAKKIGLTNSNFVNSTGWPQMNHVMSAKDLAVLATKIRNEFPDYYFYFSENEFTWDKITQKNRNPLLGKGLGVDGLKTGHTEEAGFGIVGSAKRGNRRITFVISGLKSAKLRAQEASKITEWAFRDFKAIKIINKSEEIGLLPTWLGDVSKIGLITNKDIYILAKNGEPVKSEAKILYRSYMEAPFDKDSKAPADLIITTPLPNNKSDNSAISFPLYANESVKSGDFLSQFKAASLVLRNYALDLFRIN